MVEGEKKEIIFEFINSGDEDLLIELATSCKCTEIDWPKAAIAPGEKSQIKAIFDSTGMTGTIHKTIDIIANTVPIVVEAKFLVEILPKE